MPTQLSWRELTEPDAAAMAAALGGDADARRRLDWYADHPHWWSTVAGDPHRQAWTVWLGDDRVGFLDMELDEDRATIALYVAQPFRRRGFGTLITREACTIAAALNASVVAAHVETDNVASLAACAAAGFRHAGQDEDGYHVMIHDTGDNASSNLAG